MGQEIELKLTVSPGDADQVANVVARALFPDVESCTAALDAIYFDTPDRLLRHHGASLRIRRDDGERVQTVKIDAAKGAGLFSRPEWERPVDDDHPVVEDTTPLATLLGVQRHLVEPAFAVTVERTTWRITDDSSDIEMVLDRGSVRAGGRYAPICEIELELKRGDPVALFAMARRIGERIPVRVGVLTKSERGYALSDASATAFKAEPVALDPAMTVGEALQAIIGRCLRQYRMNETILLETRSPEALHQARVALRRLRSALGIFKTVIGDRELVRLRGDLRDLGQALGRARDLDVLAATALTRTGPGPIHTRLETSRCEAYDTVDTVLAAPHTLQVMLDLVAWSATGEWLGAEGAVASRATPVRIFARRALRKRYRALKIGDRKLEELGAAERHELRKSAKTLRYSAEFFAGLFCGSGEIRRHAKFVRTLQKLQDRLGALNDRATAPALLRDLGLMEQDGAGTLIEQSGTNALVHAAGKAHRRVLARKTFWN